MDDGYLITGEKCILIIDGVEVGVRTTQTELKEQFERSCSVFPCGEKTCDMV
jgi:hypothetical protein